ncbi:hypothetical protein OX000_34045, partial [Pseudomonas aeruginosa]|uniref:DUF7024 domain-containing protein n=1 Tax=Pseudomonas aeruginosa TaxID=287 RepID=UPI00227B38F5
MLDVMGGDNYIGLGRSSLSAPSLSTVFLNIEEKINGWKPAVINQWGRWSDANLAPAVDIDYVDPLPKRFDLVP